MRRFEGIFAAFYIYILEGCFFVLGGKLLPLQGDRLASINNPGRCPGLGASALSGRTVYIGASVLSGRAAIRPRKFQLYEFCVKFIKKMHGNVCYCKYFVTFALDYENYELMIE